MASEYAFHLFFTSVRVDISPDHSELSVKEFHQVYLHCQVTKGQEQRRGWDDWSSTLFNC